MRSTFPILRVRGIPIGIHWSWVFVFAIVAWSLATVLFPDGYPGLDGTTYLAMAVAASLLFFASVLLHELGHALRAQHEGLPIQGITLWLLGGVAHLGEVPRSAGAELRVAVWGPAISLTLTLAFAALTLIGDRTGFPTAVQGVVDYLARINALVLAFNLVPALPLDGGRVLRAWLWRRTGSFVAATRWAARAGRLFGFLLVAVGLLNFFGGAGLGGLWLVFLGWFVIQSAQAEGEVAEASLVRGLGRVGGIMTRDPQVVAPSATIADLLAGAAGAGGGDGKGGSDGVRHSTYPVVDDGGRLVGVASRRAAEAVPPQRAGVPTGGRSHGAGRRGDPPSPPATRSTTFSPAWTAATGARRRHRRRPGRRDPGQVRRLAGGGDQPAPPP